MHPNSLQHLERDLPPFLRDPGKNVFSNGLEVGAMPEAPKGGLLSDVRGIIDPIR